MSEPNASTRRASASARAIVAGSIAIVLCVAGGAVIALLGNRPLPIDLAWFDFSKRTLDRP